MICCKTIIGKGSPNKAGTEAVHGAALGEKEISATRAALGWTYPPFEIPQAAYDGWNARELGTLLEGDWNARFATYQAAYPELAAEFERRLANELPAHWPARAEALIEQVNAKSESVATRKASQIALESLVPALPELLGGSADLTGSNNTHVQGMQPIGRTTAGRYLHYGVREFGMAALMNGISLHGGYIPYGGTFLTFSDYARNALRMAALMKIRSIFVFTHDSIGLGEDGPTHQPIEHVASLRLIPNLDVWRPSDAVETAVAWKSAIERKAGPTALLLSRQNVAFAWRTRESMANIGRGGYVVSEAESTPRAAVVATGSEVSLALEAQKRLATEGIFVRVVSMPSTSVFDRQAVTYRRRVLPADLPCVAVEAGVGDGWHKYVGCRGWVIGIDRYGESAPGEAVYEELGLTVENVVAALRYVMR